MFGFGKKKTVAINAPFAGECVPLDQVPDPVFAQGMAGVGVAIIPKPEAFDVCAPVDGTILMVLKTNHAVAFRADDGLELLIHVGLDTVELEGTGFSPLVTKGDKVKAGQPVLRVDAPLLAERGVNLITPVLLTNKKQVAKLEPHTGPVEVGTTVMDVEKQ